MALPAAGVIECRSDGDDLNGGGFVVDDGTDRSQQTAPHVTFDGATVTAANGAAGSTITLTGYTVLDPEDKGNYLRIASGTNFTAGLYRIVSVNEGTNSWTLDRNCTSGAGSAMVGRMGGAVATLAAAMTATSAVAGNKIWLRATANYDLTATVTPVSGTLTAAPVTIIGYGTVRGDATKPVVRCAASTVTLFTLSNNAIHLENVELQGNSQTASKGVSMTGANVTVSRCKFSGFSAQAITQNSTTSHVFDNEFTACSDSGTVSVLNGTFGPGNHVHDNTTSGIAGSALSHIIGNVVVDNSGATSDGVNAIQSGLVYGNTIARSGRDNLALNGTQRPCMIVSNVLSEPGRNNLTVGASSWESGGEEFSGYLRKNFFYLGGGSGANINNMTVAGDNVELSADPFVDAAGGDYGLNNDAGGGATVREAGFQNSFPGASFTGYRDGGAVQHEGGGGSVTTHSGQGQQVVIIPPLEIYGY